MKQKTSNAFTLIELLVVISIISILISILLPALSKARSSAETAMCLANMRQIGQATYMYASDNDGAMPLGTNKRSPANFSAYQANPILKQNWHQRLAQYSNQKFVPFDQSWNGVLTSDVNIPVWTCPADGRVATTNALGQFSYFANGHMFRSWRMNGTVAEPGPDASSGQPNFGQVSVTKIESVPKASSMLLIGHWSKFGFSMTRAFTMAYGWRFGWKDSTEATLHPVAVNGITSWHAVLHNKASNYAAVDGHAVTLKPEEISGSPSYAAGQGVEATLYFSPTNGTLSANQQYSNW